MKCIQNPSLLPQLCCKSDGCVLGTYMPILADEFGKTSFEEYVFILGHFTPYSQLLFLAMTPLFPSQILQGKTSIEQMHLESNHPKLIFTAGLIEVLFATTRPPIKYRLAYSKTKTHKLYSEATKYRQAPFRLNHQPLLLHASSLLLSNVTPNAGSE